MRKYLIGAAGLAVIATGAIAEPGKGQGKNGGGGHAAASVQAKGGGNANRGGGQQVRAQGNAQVKANTRIAARSNGNGNAKAKVQVQQRAKADVRPQQRAKADTRPVQAAKRDVRETRVSPVRDVRQVRDVRDNRDLRDNRDVRVDTRRYPAGYRVVDRDNYIRQRAFIRDDRNRGLINGCPPGLAKKYNGCTPPGLAKKEYERRYLRYDWQPRLFGLSNYQRGNYYYRDGYLMRIGSNNLISGYIPLLGGALAIGNPWPTTYTSLALPDYYVDYYDLGPANSYRYADNVIYRVDPRDSAIQSVAALLTGNDFMIGQPMPMGYDVYNVPVAYRDRYYDTPDAWYRYSDGYVYRVDPTTQLVAAAIDLLV